MTGLEKNWHLLFLAKGDEVQPWTREKDKNSCWNRSSLPAVPPWSDKLQWCLRPGPSNLKFPHPASCSPLDAVDKHVERTWHRNSPLVCPAKTDLSKFLNWSVVQTICSYPAYHSCDFKLPPKLPRIHCFWVVHVLLFIYFLIGSISWINNTERQHF